MLSANQINQPVTLKDFANIDSAYQARGLSNAVLQRLVDEINICKQIVAHQLSYPFLQAMRKLMIENATRQIATLNTTNAIFKTAPTDDDFKKFDTEINTGLESYIPNRLAFQRLSKLPDLEALTLKLDVRDGFLIKEPVERKAAHTKLLSMLKTKKDAKALTEDELRSSSAPVDFATEENFHLFLFLINFAKLDDLISTYPSVMASFQNHPTYQENALLLQKEINDLYAIFSQPFPKLINQQLAQQFWDRYNNSFNSLRKRVIQFDGEAQNKVDKNKVSRTQMASQASNIITPAPQKNKEIKAMSKEKIELSKKYDQAPGTALQKACQLIRDYSSTDGYLFSAKTARAFSFDTQVSAPYADTIAKNLDDHNCGSKVQSIPDEWVIKNVPDLLLTVIGSEVYHSLIDGDKLKAIVDVVLEKSNLTAQAVFVDLLQQKREAFSKKMEADQKMWDESDAKLKAEGRLPATNTKRATAEMQAKELEALNATREKLISLCAGFKNELGNIKNARSTEMTTFIRQLEQKLLPNDNTNTPKNTEELKNQINRFSAVLKNNAHKFKRLKDPQSERFIKQVLVILATILASIPTLGIVAGCLAAYGHFAKKDSCYFWKRTPTKAEEFKKEVDLQLKKRA